MRDFKVLLGNCEPLLNDYMEALLQDVCCSNTVLKCTRASRLDECHELARRRKFDLVMLIPNNLRQESSEPTPTSCSQNALGIVRGIKQRSSTPIIAFVLPQKRAFDEPLLKEGGADAVLGLPFDAEGFQSAVRRLLRFRRKRLASKTRQWLYQRLPRLPESDLFWPVPTSA